MSVFMALISMTICPQPPQAGPTSKQPIRFRLNFKPGYYRRRRSGYSP